MRVAPVVSDTTPLVALHALDRFDLLRDLFGQIIVPPTVVEEFVAVEAKARLSRLEGSPWVAPVPLREPIVGLGYFGLDQGEAEVIVLATQEEARLCLIDEKRGRRVARARGLAVTGTIGVLLLAKEAGLIGAVSPLLARLRDEGLYLSERVAKEALRLAGEKEL